VIVENILYGIIDFEEFFWVFIVDAGSEVIEEGILSHIDFPLIFQRLQYPNAIEDNVHQIPITSLVIICFYMLLVILPTFTQ